MGIKKQEMYTVECDNCGEYYEHDEMFPVFGDESTADNAVRNDGEWIKEDGKYYCTDCYRYDDDDNLIINPVAAKSDEFVCIQQS